MYIISFEQIENFMKAFKRKFGYSDVYHGDIKPAGGRKLGLSWQHDSFHQYPGNLVTLIDY